MNAFAIRRNVTLFAVIGAASLGLAYAFFNRGQGALDVVAGALLALIGAVYVFALVGARQPLLVADDEGISVRVGLGWANLPWTSVRQVVVEKSESWLRDGRLVVQPRSREDISDLGVFGRIHTVWATRWYGAPFGVPLSMATTSSAEDVVAEVGRLADGRTDVVALRGRHLSSLAEVPARLGALVSRVGGRDQDVDAPTEAAPPIATETVDLVPAKKRFTFGKGADEPAPDAPAKLEREKKAAEPAVAVPQQATTETSEAAAPPAPPVVPARALLTPRRAEVTREVPATAPSTADLEAATPLPVEKAPERVVFDDTTAAAPVEPAPEPVIGPRLVEARRTLRLSIDELSERTRVRPHVLEAMEVDDFGPCGGDFYARGHLTTLASVLGLDAEPLLREYEERYASGPINPRRVFEAELATGLSGGMRATVGGPKWSLLVAAVLGLMLVWGVARVFSDAPEEVAAPNPPAASAGLVSNHQPITSAKMETKTMTVTAAHADATVTVKDRTGKILWSGPLHMTDHRKVAGLAPFTVESDNAGAVEVMVMGKALGTVGVAGQQGTKSFG